MADDLPPPPQLLTITKAAADTVFINMPYATEYEERLLALISGLSLYGLVPTAATVAGEDPNRLGRIIEALSECTLSIHDLTWMSLDANEPKAPRFNMPFELGVAVALAEAVGNDYVVIDTVPNRLDKALSDIRGLDAEILDGTPMGIFRALANIFHRDDFQPEPRDFRRVLGRLNTAAARLRKIYGFQSMFEAKPFSELRRLAGKISNEIRMKAASAQPSVAPRPNQ
jgi:hypothetical protein